MKAFILTKLFLTSPRATLPVKLKISLQTACYVIQYVIIVAEKAMKEKNH